MLDRALLISILWSVKGSRCSDSLFMLRTLAKTRVVTDVYMFDLWQLELISFTDLCCAVITECHRLKRHTSLLSVGLNMLCRIRPGTHESLHTDMSLSLSMCYVATDTCYACIHIDHIVATGGKHTWVLWQVHSCVDVYPICWYMPMSKLRFELLIHMFSFTCLTGHRPLSVQAIGNI